MGDRVRVKEAHRLRGVVAGVHPQRTGDALGLTVQFDHDPIYGAREANASALYLADEVEHESAACDCVWCKP